MEGGCFVFFPCHFQLQNEIEIDNLSDHSASFLGISPSSYLRVYRLILSRYPHIILPFLVTEASPISHLMVKILYNCACLYCSKIYVQSKLFQISLGIQFPLRKKFWIPYWNKFWDSNLRGGKIGTELRVSWMTKNTMNLDYFIFPE